MAKYEVTIKERVSSVYTYIITVEADSKDEAIKVVIPVYEIGRLKPEDKVTDIKVDNTTFEAEEIQ